MQQVHQIFPLNKSRTFTEDEAYELINLFMAVTQKAKNKITSLSSQIQYHKNMPEEAQAFEAELNDELHKWSEKMKRLGGIPLSLYQVKVPARENGFFLWEFPKSDLEFHY